MFTQPQTQLAGGLFGQQPSTNQNGQTQQTNIFGSNTQQQGNLFGQPAAQPQQQGMFGAQTAQNQPQQQNLFGGGQQTQTQQTGGLFGGIGGNQPQQPQVGLGLGQQQQQGQSQQTQTGGGIQLGFGLAGGTQQQQPQQQQQQQQQQPQMKQATFGQMKGQTQKHYDNLIQAAIYKDKFEKNQQTIDNIEKNCLNSVTTQPQQQQQQQYGFIQPQQQALTQAQRELQNKIYSVRTQKAFTSWKEQTEALVNRQKETILILDDLNRNLNNSRNDDFYDLEEETLIDAIKLLGNEIKIIETKLNDVMVQQQKVLGLDRIENSWDQAVKNLCECFLQLDQQTLDIEEALVKCESHQRLQQR